MTVPAPEISCHRCARMRRSSASSTWPRCIGSAWSCSRCSYCCRFFSFCAYVPSPWPMDDTQAEQRLRGLRRESHEIAVQATGRQCGCQRIRSAHVLVEADFHHVPGAHARAAHLEQSLACGAIRQIRLGVLALAGTDPWHMRVGKEGYAIRCEAGCDVEGLAE